MHQKITSGDEKNQMQLKIATLTCIVQKHTNKKYDLHSKCRGVSYLSSVSDVGFNGLLVGELKGVPESVSLELSRWLLSREIRLELPPLELRFNSAMLCAKEDSGEINRHTIYKEIETLKNDWGFVPTCTGRYLTLFFFCTSSGGRYWWSCFFFTCVASIFIPSFSMLMLLACLYTAENMSCLRSSV